jgi:hypothetical protein
MSVSAVRARVAAVRSDQLMTNSLLMLSTTLLMAGGGALFWILAARLQSPANVGLAGSLVASAETIALFAQLGLNIALVRTLPRSRHQAADMLTTGAVVVTAATALPWSMRCCCRSPRRTSPRCCTRRGRCWFSAPSSPRARSTCSPTACSSA